ncbi:4-hydroxy-tetrahydrodipicolinate reductase [Rehaibacterium terrae]|jgi:4-hydroxy-tetrahydrodipicolinate reductase|uniref:4-hydroxy-tetrahydrodipicolinate reductase n=1 Tax=Rehaibacterium terrae TaxID=1341696 RepID=A0A7W7XYX2_9GAMM|nr:4-hydroxy-tetrahydrodipicolinate reductase [Rehaibacterium terrae]MBB5015012.1 4-hydroxy-tetrahydrodipicolinate reductase [Rehaibacterium terrae]
MTDRTLRVLIHGASGRMGRALLRLLAGDPRFVLAAAVTSRPREDLGVHPVFVAAELAEVPDFDVAIDFSLPAGFDAILDLCLRRGRPLVSGTTGLEAPQRAALDAAATRIAVLSAANFSLGVAVLAELVRRAAAALPTWDCNIVEVHHVHKQDAPSGTALHLGQAVADGRGRAPHYASLRAGDIVGEHMVQFAGQGERLELIHRATDRDIFARGALETSLRLAGRPPGRYAVADLLFGTGGR